MKKKTIIAIVALVAVAGLVGSAHTIDFIGMMKSLHGG